MGRDVAEAAPGDDKATVVFGGNAGREGGEEFAIGAEDGGFEEDTLQA